MLNEAGRIGVLFKEYDTLRTEIQACVSRQYGLLALTAGALYFVMSRPDSALFGVSLGILVLAVVVSMAYALVEINTRRCAERVREIEQEINRLAGGEPLLEWESTRGVGAVGFLPYIFRRGSRKSRSPR